MIIDGVFIGACTKCHRVVIVEDTGRSDWDMRCMADEDYGLRCGGIEKPFEGELQEVLQAVHRLGGRPAVVEWVRANGDKVVWPPDPGARTQVTCRS